MKIIVITGELNKQITEYADEVIHIAEKNSNEGIIIKPDSHLLEIAVNDAILYSVKNYKELADDMAKQQVEKENIDILLSEFKL